MRHTPPSHKKRTRKLLPVPVVALIDVVAAGACLCIFSLFHHVLPLSLIHISPRRRVAAISHSSFSIRSLSSPNCRREATDEPARYFPPLPMRAGRCV